MDINRDDLEPVWSILDEDGSRNVSYDEFCGELYKLKSSDLHTVLMITKSYITDVRRQVKDSLRLMKYDIMGGISDTLKALNVHGELLETLKESDVFHDKTWRGSQPTVCSGLPQNEDASCDSDQRSQSFVGPGIKQASFSNDHHLAMDSFLDSLGKLEKRLERNVVALGSLITTAPNTWNPAFPSSIEESIRSPEFVKYTEEKSTKYDESKQMKPSHNVGLTFVRCCDGRPATNVTTVAQEPSEVVGYTSNGQFQNLLVMPHAAGSRAV